MGVIYLIMMALPVALATFLWLALRRWTRLSTASRAAVATFAAPALFLVLYTRSTLSPAEKLETFAQLSVIYLIVNALLIGLFEIGQRNSK